MLLSVRPPCALTVAGWPAGRLTLCLLLLAAALCKTPPPSQGTHTRAPFLSPQPVLPPPRPHPRPSLPAGGQPCGVRRHVHGRGARPRAGGNKPGPGHQVQVRACACVHVCVCSRMRACVCVGVGVSWGLGPGCEVSVGGRGLPFVGLTVQVWTYGEAACGRALAPPCLPASPLPPS